LNVTRAPPCVWLLHGALPLVPIIPEHEGRLQAEQDSEE
jgi:hypothetical protein